jgi:hypothetical protein
MYGNFPVQNQQDKEKERENCGLVGVEILTLVKI